MASNKMAYQSYHTGGQIDDAVSQILDGTIAGYTSSAVMAAQRASSSASEAASSASAASSSASAASSSASAASSSASAASSSTSAASSSASEAASNAETSKSWAIGGTGTRQGENTDNSKYYAAQAANAAHVSAENAARDVRSEFENLKKLSESWATGGTGLRPGEDTNNSKYWSEQSSESAGRSAQYAELAGAYAESLVVPSARDVYNIVIQDRITHIKYAFVIWGGAPRFIPVSDAVNVSNVVFIDSGSGNAFEMVIDNAYPRLEVIQ